MGERLIVSGGGRLREFVLPQQTLLRSAALEGAGALCASGSVLYAACDWHDMIWRMDSSLLVPTGLFAGGPGICSLMLSRDAQRLYALCSEADSLLMLSADSGAPMVVNRVGVNPCAMVMDESGKMLAVAGGASGEVVLLCAGTLTILARLQTPGVVFGVALTDEAIYALSLDETMNSVLTVFGPDGQRSVRRLEGMPGAMAVTGCGVCAATHQGLWHIAPGAAQAVRESGVPGRAGRLLALADGMAMTDQWSDMLYIRGAATGGRWRALAGEARDVVTL